MKVFEEIKEKFEQEQKEQARIKRERKDVFEGRKQMAVSTARRIMEDGEPLHGIVHTSQHYTMRKGRAVYEMHSFYLGEKPQHFYEVGVAVNNDTKSVNIILIKSGFDILDTKSVESVEEAERAIHRFLEYTAEELYKALYN